MALWDLRHLNEYLTLNGCLGTLEVVETDNCIRVIVIKHLRMINWATKYCVRWTMEQLCFVLKRN